MDRYTQRTVQWGHWGITFMNTQPDRTKNFGAIVGNIYFPVGVCGPADLPRKNEYLEMCRAWVEDGKEPDGLVR